MSTSTNLTVTALCYLLGTALVCGQTCPDKQLPANTSCIETEPKPKDVVFRGSSFVTCTFDANNYNWTIDNRIVTSCTEGIDSSTIHSDQIRINEVLLSNEGVYRCFNSSRQCFGMTTINSVGKAQYIGCENVAVSRCNTSMDYTSGQTGLLLNATIGYTGIGRNGKIEGIISSAWTVCPGLSNSSLCTGGVNVNPGDNESVVPPGIIITASSNNNQSNNVAMMNIINATRTFQVVIEVSVRNVDGDEPRRKTFLLNYQSGVSTTSTSIMTTSPISTSSFVMTTTPTPTGTVVDTTSVTNAPGSSSGTPVGTVSSTAEGSDDGGDGSTVGIVVGVVVGAILFLVVVIILIIWVWRNRRNHQGYETKATYTSGSTTNGTSNSDTNGLSSSRPETLHMQPLSPSGDDPPTCGTVDSMAPILPSHDGTSYNVNDNEVVDAKCFGDDIGNTPTVYL